MAIWTPRTTVAAVIENQGRFLMVEERDGGGRLVLNQPAGHLEDGESLVDAVRREVLEETGWEIEPRGLLGVYKWRVPKSGITYLRYCFWGHGLERRNDVFLDPDIEQALWLAGSEIIMNPDRHRSPMVARCLGDYLNGRRFGLELINEID